MLKDFKEFAMRGSVVDMAVGVVIGGAFGKIATSLVNDIVMPPIGFLLGKVDFSGRFFNLSRHPYATLAEAKAAGAPIVSYGLFINTVLDFVIVSLAIFLAIRQLNRFLSRSVSAPARTVKTCPFCFSSVDVQAKRCAYCTSNLEQDNG